MIVRRARPADLADVAALHGAAVRPPGGGEGMEARLLAPHIVDRSHGGEAVQVSGGGPAAG